MANINKIKGVIGILTGGGDVPGLNPAIRAVTIRALREGWALVKGRGACGLAWSFCTTAVMDSRWTSRPSLSRGLAGSITARGSG